MKLKPRLVDFCWYYKAFADLGVSCETHAKAFAFAAWLSHTFNLVLIVQDTRQNSYKKVI